MKDITWRGIQRRPVGGSQRVLSCRGSQNWCSVVPPREGEAPAEPRVKTNGCYCAFFWVGLFHHGKTNSTEKRRGDGRTICGCRPRKGEACGAAWDSLAWDVFGSAGASPSRRDNSPGNAIWSCAQDFALIRNTVADDQDSSSSGRIAERDPGMGWFSSERKVKTTDCLVFCEKLRVAAWKQRA